jgi:hypothetical protein
VTVTPPPAKRQGSRHNQISIRLHYALGADWHLVDAHGWSEHGFYFFHAQPLHTGLMSFKRSLLHFDGEIVWSKVFRDEAQVLEMLMNGAIHQQSEKLDAQPDMQQRLLNLMRVHGMVEAKQRVLSALGGPTTQAQWQARVQERLQKPLYQSGVQVDSPAWRAVVAEALPLGDVVQDLERWSGTLKGH